MGSELIIGSPAQVEHKEDTIKVKKWAYLKKS